MIKNFIWWICQECQEPTSIVKPCKILGYNNFPETNFHGELTFKDTEILRENLIKSLEQEDRIEDAKKIKTATKVISITFN